MGLPEDVLRLSSEAERKLSPYMDSSKLKRILLDKQLAKSSNIPISPLDYTFGISKKFTPLELEALEISKALSNNRRVRPSQKILNEYMRYAGDVTVPMGSKGGGTLSAVGNDVSKKLMSMGISPQAIKDTTFSDIITTSSSGKLLTRAAILGAPLISLFAYDKRNNGFAPEENSLEEIMVPNEFEMNESPSNAVVLNNLIEEKPQSDNLLEYKGWS